MPSTLDYGGREANVRSLAVPAFICGALSGPAAFGLALLGAHNHLDEQTKELLGLSALIIVLGGAFVFGCIVRARLPGSASSRIRVFANLAIAAAPILWGVVITVFILYALSQV